jgi:hypothetical protein
MNANGRLDGLVGLRHFMVVAVSATVVIASQCNAAFFQQPGNAADFEPSKRPQLTRLQADHENQHIGDAEIPADAEEHVKRLTLAGRYHLVKGTRKGVLILKVQIPKDSYIYAVTQPGNPPPSRITVTESSQFRIAGNFASDRHPKIIEEDPVFHSRLEKHFQLVQFFVPIELAENADPQKVMPEIVFDGQVCSEKGTCMPIRNRKISAQFAGYFEQQAEKPADSRNHHR